MKKPKQIAKKAAHSPPSEGEDTSVAQLRLVLGEGVEGIRRCIAKVNAMLIAPGAEYDDKKASHLAWLTKLLAQILSEVRKQEAADRKEVGQLSHAVVMSYLRQLTPERRQEMAADLTAIDSGEEELAL